METDTAIQTCAGRHGSKLARHFRHLSAHAGQSFCLLHSNVKSTAELLAELRAEPGVAYAEPDYRRYFSDLRTPNDTYFSQLWSLRNTGQSVVGGSGTTNDDISFLKADDHCTLAHHLANLCGRVRS